MKVGILSDTHDNLPKVKQAVSLFNKNKIGFVFHAGDFVAPFTALKLKALKCDWLGVFGNNDGERAGLIKASEGRIKEAPLRINLSGKKITLVHDILSINQEKESADIIIFGHNHKAEIIKKDSKLIVNPGECGGWLYGKSTVAILDLDSLAAKIHKL